MEIAQQAAVVPFGTTDAARAYYISIHHGEEFHVNQY